MAAPVILRPKEPDSPGPLPPLIDGDRLTRDEFERRYDAMPDLKKAELIEGVVYMGSPVRVSAHGVPHARLLTWFGIYCIQTPGVVSAGNTTVRLDLTNEPQPDVFLLIDPAKGGQCQIVDDYVTDAPELVAEVSASTARLDLGPKFQVYRRNRVREYIAWRVMEEAIDWFVLRGDQFERLAPGEDGITRSEVFPGLWLDSAALLAGDMPRVIEVLQHGLASPEHAALVAKLQ